MVKALKRFLLGESRVSHVLQRNMGTNFPIGVILFDNLRAKSPEAT